MPLPCSRVSCTSAECRRSVIRIARFQQRGTKGDAKPQTDDFQESGKLYHASDRDASARAFFRGRSVIRLFTVIKQIAAGRLPYLAGQDPQAGSNSKLKLCLRGESSGEVQPKRWVRRGTGAASLASTESSKRPFRERGQAGSQASRAARGLSCSG